MTLRPHAPKSKACSVCAKPFMPARPMQAVCSPRCAHRKVRLDKTKERAQVRERKEKIKTIPTLIKEAQIAFNAYIRLRDKGRPCICCGKPLGDGEVGGEFDAGHYRSTGSASHLRFHESNAHAQRKHCNRYLSGNAVAYRSGLIARIGVEAVEELEASNQPHKWTAEELRQIRETYKQKRKQLERDE